MSLALNLLLADEFSPIFHLCFPLIPFYPSVQRCASLFWLTFQVLEGKFHHTNKIQSQKLYTTIAFSLGNFDRLTISRDKSVGLLLDLLSCVNPTRQLSCVNPTRQYMLSFPSLKLIEICLLKSLLSA